MNAQQDIVRLFMDIVSDIFYNLMKDCIGFTNNVTEIVVQIISNPAGKNINQEGITYKHQPSLKCIDSTSIIDPIAHIVQITVINT